MAKIGVKTFAPIVKTKSLGEKLPKHQQEKKEQGNNVDYGEVATFFLALSISFHDGAWYIDSRASMHLSHKWEWFKDFEEIPPMKIYLGDNSIQKAVGRGKMMALLKLRNKKTYAYFNNVFYAYGLAKNILA